MMQSVPEEVPSFLDTWATLSLGITRVTREFVYFIDSVLPPYLMESTAEMLCSVPNQAIPNQRLDPSIGSISQTAQLVNCVTSREFPGQESNPPAHFTKFFFFAIASDPSVWSHIQHQFVIQGLPLWRKELRITSIPKYKSRPPQLSTLHLKLQRLISLLKVIS